MLIHNLKTLKLDDNSIFREYLERSNPVWANYFPILYSNRKNVRWKVIDSSLCVFQKNTYSKVNECEKTWSMAFLPVPFSENALNDCFGIMDGLNRQKQQKEYGINNIDGNRAILNKLNNYKIEYASEGTEYLYNVNDSQTLAGSKYNKIRNRISQFERNFNPKIEKYSSDMYEECLGLFEDWKQRKTKNENVVLYKEHIEEIFRELWMFEDMFGVVVRVNGELAAFSLGGILSEEHNTATCIIRKTKSDMNGLSEYIDRKFYDYLPKNITTVNDGDDCMSPTLADYKTKWRPINVQPIFKANIASISQTIGR